LVEVSLAIGILAVAVLPLIALAAHSAQVDRRSQDTVVSALIASDMIGMLQQADWQAVQEWQSTGGAEAYYDIDGQAMGDSSNAREAASFTARLHFPTHPAPSSYNVQAVVLVSGLPGALGQAEIDDFLNNPTPQSDVRRFPTMAVHLEKAP